MLMKRLLIFILLILSISLTFAGCNNDKGGFNKTLLLLLDIKDEPAKWNQADFDSGQWNP